MRISDVHIYRFALPLTDALLVGETQLTAREGAVVALVDENGRQHPGEVAPLPGYSDESLEQAVVQLLDFKRRLIGSELPNALEELSGKMASWLEGGEVCGSVRFGLESAALQMIATNRRTTVSSLLSGRPLKNLAVNALISSHASDPTQELKKKRDMGFRAFKMKIGRGEVKSDIEAVQRACESLHEGEALRLDANQAWSMEQAAAFCETVDWVRMEYLEEPLIDPDELERLGRQISGARLARDESLRMIVPSAEVLTPEVHALVLKPTILGVERSMQWARLAHRHRVTAVFSSAFESSLGLSLIAHLAAAAESEAAAGLDTLAWLADDLTDGPLDISDGRISIDAIDVVAQLKWDQLERIDDD